VWVVPTLLYVVSRGWYATAWVLGLVFFVAPMWFLPMDGHIELRYPFWQVAVSAVYVVVGLVLLLLLGLRRSRPSAEVAR